MSVKEKISGSQLGLLLFAFVVATILLTVPEVMVKYAKQDAWLSAIPASVTGIITIYVMTSLADRYPGMTIDQYSSHIVGKWLGKVLSLYFSYYHFFLVASVGYEHTVFVSTVILPRTPTVIEVITFFILCGIAAFLGIEVLSRCNQFLVPLSILFLIPLFVLAIWDFEPSHLKPVLAEGMLPVIEGAVLPSAWMCQFFYLGWLLPYLNQPHVARRVSFAALLGIGIVITIINLMAIMVFGPLTPKLNYSFMRVIQYIGQFTPFERLEAILVAFWTMGFFVKTSVLLFVLCLNVSLIFDLKDYRPIVLPMTLLSIIGSVWIFTSTAEWQTWIPFGYPFLAFFTHTLLPLFLLVIDTIKRKRRDAKQHRRVTS